MANSIVTYDDRARQRMKKYIAIDPEGCWIWNGSIDSGGYGQLRYQGKMTLVHRLALMLFRGVNPGPLHVLHQCDKPRCCNPDHLFLGTNADNMRDMRNKGRAPKGEQKAISKLTSSDILKIRSLAKAGWTHRAIGREFGIHHSTVGHVLRGSTWSHVS